MVKNQDQICLLGGRQPGMPGKKDLVLAGSDDGF